MTKTILVIEDDPDVRDFEAMVLTREGFAVETASTGSAALEQLERKTYDGIVLDVGLPEIDGVEIARRIRTLKANRRTPLIMVTGSDDPQARSEGFAAGVVVFLNKPITASSFRSAIHSAMR